MSPKISLITAVAVTALAVGAPVALGEGHHAGSQPSALPQPDPMIEDGYARAVATTVAPAALGSEHTPEWAARAEKLGQLSSNPVDGYVDANQRVVEPQSLKALRARSEGLNREYGLGDYATVNGYVDGPERAPRPWVQRTSRRSTPVPESNGRRSVSGSVWASCSHSASRWACGMRGFVSRLTETCT